MRRIVCLWFALLTPAAHAQTYNWTNTVGGTYSTPGNWSPSGPPTASGIARFALNNTYSVFFTANASALTLALSNGDVGFYLNGYSFQLTDTLNNGVGNNATPTNLRIFSGTFLPGNLFVGGSPGVASSVSLSQSVAMTVGSGAFFVGLSGTGSFSAVGGSTVTTTSGAVGLGLNATGVGSMLISDAGSSLNVPGTFRVADAGQGTLTIQNAATATIGALEIGQTTGAVGLLNLIGAGSTLTVSGTTTIAGTAVGSYAASATLNIGAGTTVNLNGTTNLRTTATVNLTGGTLNLNTLNAQAGATVNWSSGKLQFVDGSSITGPVLDLLLAGTHTLGTGRTLSAPTGTLTLDTPLVVAGGTLNAPTLNINAPLTVGTFGTVSTNDIATIGSAQTVQVSDFGTLAATTAVFNNGGLLQLNGPAANVTGFMANNFGVVQGTGRFAGGLNNGTGGTIRARAGDHIIIDAVGNTNSGNIELSGGTLEYSKPLSNLGTGYISGRGEFRGGTSSLGTSGLSNLGIIALSAGITDIRGDVLNAGPGRIVAAGGAIVTFYDDVTHNGVEIRTNSGARTVFFGSQSGAGPFTGTGTVEYNGDLRPGNSPANISYDGSVEFTPSAKLLAEIGGATAGSQHDRLTIAGSVSLGGASLQLQLINGYIPAPGQQFTIIDNTSAGALNGTFAGLPEGALLSAGAAQFLVSYIGGTGNDFVVTAVPEPTSILLIGLMGFGAFRATSSSWRHTSPARLP